MLPASDHHTDDPRASSAQQALERQAGSARPQSRLAASSALFFSAAGCPWRCLPQAATDLPGRNRHRQTGVTPFDVQASRTIDWLR
jgi:hypothetical protein